MESVPFFGFCANILSIWFNLITNGSQEMEKRSMFGKEGYLGSPHSHLFQGRMTWMNGLAVKAYSLFTISLCGIRKESRRAGKIFNPPSIWTKLRIFLWLLCRACHQSARLKRIALDGVRMGNIWSKKGTRDFQRNQQQVSAFGKNYGKWITFLELTHFAGSWSTTNSLQLKILGKEG